MAVISSVASIEALAEIFAATGEFTTAWEAVQAGVINETGIGIIIETVGGPGTAVAVANQTALEVAGSASLSAGATSVGTAGVTLAQTQTGYTLAAMGSMSLPAVAAAAAPVLGVSLGAGLYKSNPNLWTQISKKLLPFCYPGTTEIPTWAQIVQSTGAWQMLVSAGVIEALKQVFQDNDVPLYGDTTIYVDSDLVTEPLPTGSTMQAYDPVTHEPTYTVHAPYDENAAWWRDEYNVHQVIASASPDPRYPNSYTHNGYTVHYFGGTAIGSAPDCDYLPLLASLSAGAAAWTLIFGDASGTAYYPEGTSEWEGAAAPTTIPYIPIIIVPEPIEPSTEPETEPTVPISPPAVPQLPPHVDPIPLPAPPDPETEPPPESWPEEEPWPTTIPFPWPPPETSPDPDDWPEVIPWPLPEEPPEEWPKHPEPWEWPEELPWPRSPEEWPETVPWPDEPPDPEEWPEEIPWPERPDEWPETVPWPVPWPENWPEEAPWPVPWPEEIPYPIPWPWPEPTPQPKPEDKPGEIKDPKTEVEPYIDPIPWPYDEPKPYSPTEPTSPTTPYKDPSQPEPYTPPGPTEEPDPTQPNPPPPEGTITPPPLPYIPLPFSSSTGIITVYHPDQSTLLAFANWLWVTWQDATIDKIWNNPFDGVITLFELYCTPTDVGTKNIRSGFLDSGIPSPIISRYTEINCGTLGIPEYYGNYLDYAPYSKAYIYLPFIGVVELNVDDIVGHGVNVTYKIDEYNGSCIAMITVAKVTTVNGEQVEYNNVFYQYSGNCAVELPIAGGSQAAIKAGMIEAAAWGLGSVISGVITGGMGGGLGIGASIGNNLAQGAASAVHSVVSAKSSVQHSGSFGSSYGALGAKIPFITIVRPKQLQIANYNELYGYQAHKAVTIGACTGYLRCREVHVISPTASDEEKAQIEQLLKTGVYVTE